jgi:hypothetical protein
VKDHSDNQGGFALDPARPATGGETRIVAWSPTLCDARRLGHVVAELICEGFDPIVFVFGRGEDPNLEACRFINARWTVPFGWKPPREEGSVSYLIGPGPEGPGYIVLDWAQLEPIADAVVAADGITVQKSFGVKSRSKRGWSRRRAA